jgi:hypothetical protein
MQECRVSVEASSPKRFVRTFAYTGTQTYFSGGSSIGNQMTNGFEFVGRMHCLTNNVLRKAQFSSLFVSFTLQATSKSSGSLPSL